MISYVHSLHSELESHGKVNFNLVQFEIGRDASLLEFQAPFFNLMALT